MEEEQTQVEVERRKTPVEYYFQKAKDMGLNESHMLFFSNDAKDMYVQHLRAVYDVLYDRVMTSDISPFLKQEVEQWYDFNREFLGFMRTTELNGELERMLTRFNLV